MHQATLRRAGDPLPGCLELPTSCTPRSVLKACPSCSQGQCRVHASCSECRGWDVAPRPPLCPLGPSAAPLKPVHPFPQSFFKTFSFRFAPSNAPMSSAWFSGLSWSHRCHRIHEFGPFRPPQGNLPDPLPRPGTHQSAIRLDGFACPGPFPCMES